ncbi:hypothetical protein EYF80_031826 [Liparis tanakae]|uniref:Uncharacterized protein n=1 Tax=Liparis tanakae TaxID=230148 RepID=A0A4Z2GXC8_9TELE|nr:hypothetical protein EYF80_031826 [Liparis tanakae]
MSLGSDGRRGGQGGGVQLQVKVGTGSGVVGVMGRGVMGRGVMGRGEDFTPWSSCAGRAGHAHQDVLSTHHDTSFTKCSLRAMPAPASKMEERVSPLKSVDTTWEEEDGHTLNSPCSES